MAYGQSGPGYGKRPLWQWIALYAVIAVVLYGLVYYFVFAKNGSSGYNQPNPYSAAPTPTQTNPTPTGGNIITTRTDAAKGNYLADFAGMTLYVFDKDTAGTSNCSGTCTKVWPPYTPGATAQSQLPTNVTVIKRADGTSQFAWMDKPLYYYATDQKPGDVTGDGVGGTWHLVKPQ